MPKKKFKNSFLSKEQVTLKRNLRSQCFELNGNNPLKVDIYDREEPMLMKLLYLPIALICRFPFIFLAIIFWRTNNAINWINHSPTDEEVGFVKTYPLNIDFSGEWRESVEQPGTLD